MFIRRWLPRRGSLVLATLAMTAAAVITPAPASASSTSAWCDLITAPVPRQNASGTTVSADGWVSCSGLDTSSVALYVDILREGVTVGSASGYGSFAASATAYTSCVPGNYVATAYASIWHTPGSLPLHEVINWRSPTYTITCVPRPVVANPGTRTWFVNEPGSLQMTATGGAPPYTWSATGLPIGMSLNPSTGLISGNPTRLGAYTVVVTARDTAGSAGSTSFTWNIRRDVCPTCKA